MKRGSSTWTRGRLGGWRARRFVVIFIAVLAVMGLAEVGRHALMAEGGLSEGHVFVLAAALVAAAVAAFLGMAPPLASATARGLRAPSAQGIVDLADEAIVSVDGWGRVVGFNPSAEAAFGYDADEILGHSLDLLLPKEARADHAKQMAAFAAGGESGRPMGRRREISGRRRDGTVFPCEASILFQETRDGPMFTAILRDVTERRRREDELREAKRAAELSDRAKTEFLSMMSHELRTPLNAILGFSHLMAMDMDDGKLDPAYRDQVDAIAQSGERLLELIGNMLAIADMEAGRCVLHEETVSIGPLIDSVTTISGGQAERGEVGLVADVAAELPALEVDPARLKQALTNLVSNGIKFNRPGGRVTVAARPGADGGLVLSVSDDGAGMAPAEQAAALDLFGQVDRSTTRAHEGAGLGLPLAQRIAEAHGATLALDSAPGQGTTVTLTFPPERVVAG
jgi:PAS domain S-box-containing protein